jgi:sec-independent protein translocase protein TatB
MNIFSNIGITELIFILLLALLVVGPERLPELARQIGKVLRDIRKAYENLTRDLGPEFTSIQQTTQELRESVEAVRSIPKDVVQSVVKAADLDETIQELKGVTDNVGQIGRTLADAKRTIQNPVKAAVSTAQGALLPAQPAEQAEKEEELQEEEKAKETEPERADGPAAEQAGE